MRVRLLYKPKPDNYTESCMVDVYKRQGDYIAGSRTVDLHVQRVRKKVGWEDFLITVPKMGYRLEVPR